MARKHRPNRSRLARKSGTRHVTPLTLEHLESRIVPATIRWDGGGDGVNWSNAANWDTNTLPGSNDDVILDVAGSPNIVITGGHNVRSVTSSESVRFYFGLVNASVGYTNLPSGTMTLQSAALNGPLINQGTLISEGHTEIIGSPITTAPGSLIRVVSTLTNGTNTLRIANGFTNNGTIELTSVVNMPLNVEVNSGTLTNAPGGVINVLAGAGGTRSFDAPLNNQGTLRVSGSSLTLSRASADHVNSGTIELIGGDVTINGSGTTPSFTHSGSITVAAGRQFAADSLNFIQPSGTISGAGTVSLSAFGGTNSLAGVTVGSLLLGSGTFNYSGDMTIAAGSTLTLVSSTINAPVVNQGTITVIGVSTINGTLTTMAGSLIRLTGNTSSQELRLASGFTNLGTIELTSSSTNATAFLRIASGTLTNAPGGVITTLAGAGGTRTLERLGVNQGTLDIGAPTTITGTLLQNAPTGTIIVRAGRTLTAGAVENQGTLTLEAGATLAVSPAISTPTPAPYLSFDDSPFRNQTFDYFHLENFEDGLFNTPGVTASIGSPLGPGNATDSVDGDDGAINGNGNAGWSFFASTTAFNFTFNSAALGGLPTHVGLVWTDGGGSVTFEAFDASGVSLGVSTPVTLGDGSFTGWTSEDRLFWLTSPAGIGSIVIRSTVTGMEVDHLQYGRVSESMVAFTQTAAGTLNTNIGALNSFGRVQTGRAVSLAGTVNVAVTSPYVPNDGDTFAVVTGSSRTGSFGTINGVDIANGVLFDPVHNATGLTLHTIGAPGNSAPVAVDDPISTSEEFAVTFDVLSNDSDADNDPVTITTFTQPAQGTLVRNANGTFTYTPAAHYFGITSFTYNVRDGRGGVDSATVTITVQAVNDAPVPTTAATVTLNEDATAFVALTGTDADNDPLTVVVTRLPARGTLYQTSADGQTLTAPGTVVTSPTRRVAFRPAANEFGTTYADLGFTLSDGQVTTSERLVTFNVTSINDIPVANPDSGATNVGTAVNIAVLANDTDHDGDPLYVSSVNTTSTAGTVAINSNGTLRFTPAVNFVGATTFTYNANDNRGGNSTVTVTVVAGPVPDLVISTVELLGGPYVGSPASVPVRWTVTNAGDAATVVSWSDRVYFTTDTVLGNADDILLADVDRPQALNAGAAYTTSRTVSLAGNRTGFVYVRTDALGHVSELANEGNNDSALRAVATFAPTVDLTVEAVSVGDGGPIGSPTTVPISWRVRNLGNSTAPGTWTDRIVLSTDDVLDAGDIVVTTVGHTLLSADVSYTASVALTLPPGFSGSYHVFVLTDFGSVVGEIDETNNVGRTFTAFTVTPRPDPDLVVSAASASAAIAAVGDTVTVNWTVDNVGPGEAQESWVDTVNLSLDGTLTGATLLGSVARDTGTLTFTVPAVAVGDYQLLVVTDSGNAVFEGSGEGNNLRSAGTLAVRRPNLTVEVTPFSDPVMSGLPVTVNWVTRNATVTTPTGWTDRVYLSADATFSADDLLLGSLARTSALAAGGSVPGSVTATVPAHYAGTYTVFVVADATGTVAEQRETDNVDDTPLTVQLSPTADMRVSELTVTPLGIREDIAVGDPASIDVSWRVHNDGASRGVTNAWGDEVVLIDALGQETALFTRRRTGGLEPGQSYLAGTTIRLPRQLSGAYTVEVRSDALGAVFENGAKANNRRSAPLTIFPREFADLNVTSVTTEPTGQSGRTLRVSWRVRNDGIASTDTHSGADKVFLVRPGETAAIAGTEKHYSRVGQLDLGGEYEQIVEFPLPPELLGTYHVVVQAAALGGTPFENGLTGNNRIQTGPVTVLYTPLPDLVVENDNVVSILAPSEADPGTRIDVTWAVRNVGIGDATGTWTDRVVLQQVGRSTFFELGRVNKSGPLQAGTFYQRTEQFVLPSSLNGLYQVVVTTNFGNRIFEALTDNNITGDFDPIIVTGPRPDLQITSVEGPSDIIAGGRLSLAFTVTNQGTADTPPGATWKDRVYLSLDNVLTTDDILIVEQNNLSSLKIGESYVQRDVSYTLPRTAGGQYFVLVVTDATNKVDEEPFEQNNSYTVYNLFVTPLPPADLVVSDVAAPDVVFNGSTITVSYRVTNHGLAGTTVDAWTDTLWLTRDANRPHPLAGDIKLTQVGRSGYLDLNGSYTRSVTVPLPTTYKVGDANVPLTGEWFITPFADFYDEVLEATFDTHINPDDPNELDNNNYKARAITLVEPPPPPPPPPPPLPPPPPPIPPDLAVTVFVVTPVVPLAGAIPTNPSGELVNVTYTVTNIGSGAVLKPGSWYDTLVLSTSTDGTRPLVERTEVTGIDNRSPLASGASYTRTMQLELPRCVDGLYSVRLAVAARHVESNDTFRYTVANETTHTSNHANQPLRIVFMELDLTVSSATVSNATPIAGSVIRVNYTEANPGLRATRNGWTDRVLLSSDPSRDLNPRGEGLWVSRYGSAADMIVGEENRIFLGSNQSFSDFLDVRIPIDAVGTYYLLVSADDPSGGRPGNIGKVEEFHKEGNNLFVIPITVTPLPPPDLRVTAVSLQGMTVTYTVTNAGADTHAGQDAWGDALYLSVDRSLDTSRDIYLTRQSSGTTVLAADGTYTRTVSFKAPSGLTGAYYVLVSADTGKEVFESDENNNVRASDHQIVIAPPPPGNRDIQIDPTSIRLSAGQPLAGDPVSFRWTGIDAGTTAVDRTWEDALYLSLDGVYDNSDLRLGTFSHSSLAPGATYTGQLNNIRLPATLPTSYRLIVRADIKNTVPEGTNEVNNTVVSSDALHFGVEELFLNTPRNIPLASKQEKLFRLTIGQGQTLRVSVTGASGTATELFIRPRAVPTGFAADEFRDEAVLRPSPVVVVPSTEPDTYYILVRGVSGSGNPTVLAEVLPLEITDVKSDAGGDSRHVTTVIKGAQFRDGAIVKLVRPGIGEYTPVSQRFVDSTEIVAIFDLTGARAVRREGHQPRRAGGHRPLPLPRRARCRAGRHRRHGRPARHQRRSDRHVRAVPGQPHQRKQSNIR